MVGDVLPCLDWGCVMANELNDLLAKINFSDVEKERVVY